MENLFEPILRGTKTCTIRLGSRPITLGPLLFRSTAKQDNLQVEVNVTDVIVKRAGDITDEEAQKDGVQSAKDLFTRIRVFYPNLVDDDIITVITFETVPGTLAPVY
jgi:hypothetical protein